MPRTSLSVLTFTVAEASLLASTVGLSKPACRCSCVHTQMPVCAAGFLPPNTRSHGKSVRLSSRVLRSRIGPLGKVMMYELDSSFGRWRMKTRPCYAQSIAATNSMCRHCCWCSVSFSLARLYLLYTPYSSVLCLDHYSTYVFFP